MLHENIVTTDLSKSARLARLSVDARRLHNATYARNGAAEFACGDETLRFNWEYSAQPFAPQWLGSIEFGEARVWLALEYLGAVVALGAQAAQLLPRALRKLVLLQAFAPALDRIEALTGKQISVNELDGEQSVMPSSTRVYFSLRNVSTQLRSRGWLQCDDPRGIDALIAAASLLPSLPDAAWEASTLPVRLEIGTMQLACSDIARLEPGDCLLVTKLQRHGNGLAVLARVGSRGDYLFSGTVLADKLTIVEINAAMQREDRMPLETVNEAMAKLDTVELTLSFDLGEHALSLGEIKALQPGFVVALERPVDDNVVRLRVGGRLVGTGQLVAIGDQLGVRIMEFAAGDP